MKKVRTGPERRQRALRITLLVAFLLALPAAFALYWTWKLPELTEDVAWSVPAFVLNDESGIPVTRYDLETHVTILTSFGDRCERGCDQELRAAREAAAWIQKRLVYGDENETSPVKLLAVGTSLPELPENWRKVRDNDPEAARAFTPPRHDPREPALVVIDQDGMVRFRRPLASPGLMSDLKPFLSRLVMHHYMDDYLAKRTFFRRTPKDEAKGG